MRIAVCIKQVIDPEIPISQFKIDAEKKVQKKEGHNLVISSFDENALEVAMKLREKTSGHVTAITLGEASAVEVLKKALALGANEAVLISDAVLNSASSQIRAAALAKGVQKAGTFDMVLCGCESGDWGNRIMGSIIAEILKFPFLAYAVEIDKAGEKLRIKRAGENGFEIWEAAPPIVLSILSHETNVPRFAKLKDIMAAAKKSIPKWSVADIGLEPASFDPSFDPVEIEELKKESRDSRCEILEGEPEEQVAVLIAKLRERKVF